MGGGEIGGGEGPRGGGDSTIERCTLCELLIPSATLSPPELHSVTTIPVLRCHHQNYTL